MITQGLAFLYKYNLSHMLSLLIFFHISISISYFLCNILLFFSSSFSYFLLLTMADNNNNNINNVSAGSGSSSRGTTNRGRHNLYYVTRPPPRVEGDASNKTKGPKYPGMQDVFGRRPGKWSFDFVCVVLPISTSFSCSLLLIKSLFCSLPLYTTRKSFNSDGVKKHEIYL